MKMAEMNAVKAKHFSLGYLINAFNFRHSFVQVVVLIF